MGSMMDRRGFLRGVVWAGAGGLFGCRYGGFGEQARVGLTPAIIGGSTDVGGMDIFSQIELLGDLGFSVIEIDMANTGLLTDDVAGRVRSALAGFDFVAAHLPFMRLHYFGPPGEEVTRSTEVIESGLESAALCGATLAVMHINAPPDGVTAEESWPWRIAGARRFGDLAQRLGVRLAIETDTENLNSVAEFVRFIREIDHDNVGWCLDVGHQSEYREFVARFADPRPATPEAIKYYNDINLDLIDQIGDKLIHCHVHDIDPQTFIDHHPIGLGVIDYPRLIGKLEEVGYRGVWILEVRKNAETARTVLVDCQRRLRRFLFEAAS